jgi:RNA polymerase sigma-70 factor, ECF subfamily
VGSTVTQAPGGRPPRDGSGRSDRAAQRRAREALQAAAGDQEALAAVLDPLAVEAAGGSAAAVELVVWAVDSLGLARPTIRQLLVDEAEVDEAAQDVLVAVAETIASFRGEARFTTWLHRVAWHKSVALLRRRRPVASLPADERVGDALRISSMIATRASVREVVATLPDHYREAVVLRDIEHLTYDEVAARLDLNLNTVRTRIARGRALVAAHLVER